jgi:hypothetical protein
MVPRQDFWSGAPFRPTPLPPLNRLFSRLAIIPTIYQYPNTLSR